MPQQGFHCIVDFEDVSFEHCIGCASTLGRCQMTPSLLRGMAEQARSRNVELPVLPAPASMPRPAEAGCAGSVGERTPWSQGLLVDAPGATEAAASDDPDDPAAAVAAPAVPVPALSVTALVGCLRQTYLKATEPYFQRPDQQYWSYRGTLSHLLVEQGAGADVVAEQRFERELRLPSGRAVTISGRPDEIDPARKLLIDYKTTDRAPRQPSPLHGAQLNVYRWLVAPLHPVERLGIVYLTMKGIKKAGVPIWPDGQVERFLAERAGALADAYAGGPWPDLTEDRWMCNFCPVAAICERGPLPAPSLPPVDLADVLDAADLADPTAAPTTQAAEHAVALGDGPSSTSEAGALALPAGAR